MTLAHPQLDTVLPADGGFVPTLVIENQDFFRTFLQDISDQIAGMEGKAALSQDDHILAFSRSAELIDGYLNFSLNRKPLLGKILAALEREAVSEQHYLDAVGLLAEMERLVSEISFLFPVRKEMGDQVCSGG